MPSWVRDADENRPAMMGPPLAAHGTVSTTGNWSQLEGGLRPARVATQAPAGRYRIVVGGKVSVPITVVGVSALASRYERPTQFDEHEHEHEHQHEYDHDGRVDRPHQHGYCAHRL